MTGTYTGRGGWLPTSYALMVEAAPGERHKSKSVDEHGEHGRVHVATHRLRRYVRGSAGTTGGAQGRYERLGSVRAGAEPELLAYNVYFNDGGTRMTVLHINLDSASLERHMKVAGPKFPPIGQLIRLLSIDVYGRPDAGLVEGLRQKAQMLGSGIVRVHDLHAGFARLAQAQVQ